VVNGIPVYRAGAPTGARAARALEFRAR